MYCYFSTTFAFEHSSRQWTCGSEDWMFAFAEFNIISSAIMSHSPCGLHSRVEYHFFSDPGPRSDHLPGEILYA